MRFTHDQSTKVIIDRGAKNSRKSMWEFLDEKSSSQWFLWRFSLYLVYAPRKSYLDGPDRAGLRKLSVMTSTMSNILWLQIHSTRLQFYFYDNLNVTSGSLGNFNSLLQTKGRLALCAELCDDTEVSNILMYRKKTPMWSPLHSICEEFVNAVFKR
jgi:hypothetical protein